MVALPLFGEPGLVANGSRWPTSTYNPSVDGILWNVALWTTAEAGARRTEPVLSALAGPDRERDPRGRATMPFAPVPDTGATSSEWRNRQTR